LKKQESVTYKVERSFLSKFSVEELLSRIIKAHLDQNIVKNNSVK